MFACDASSYSIGAVLSHRMPDGKERPVGFISRTLTRSEKKYSQIEKEGLACVFGVTRFHDYLYGHSLILQTDHKSPLSLFNDQKSIPAQASGRIQCWALKLAACEYTITCGPTNFHANVDTMSRLPIPETPKKSSPLPEFILMVQNLQEAPLTAHQIAHWIARVPILSTVLRCVREGWPVKMDDEFKPY